MQAAENVDVPENNPLLDKLDVIQSQEKVKQTQETEIKSKEEPMRLGLFDDYTATQPDNTDETEPIVFVEEIYEPEKTLGVEDTQLAPVENTSEENLSMDAESGNSKPLEGIFTVEEPEENNDSIQTQVIDETIISLDESSSKENAKTSNSNLRSPGRENILPACRNIKILNSKTLQNHEVKHINIYGVYGQKTLTKDLK